jgi:hypothetical protein
MNRKDIEKLRAAGTEVAVNLSFYAHQQGLGEFSNVGRGIILEINPDGRPRKESETWRSDRERRKQIVRVSIDGFGERWVGPRFILATWKEYTTAREAFLESERRSDLARAKREERAKASQESLQRLLDSLGIQARVQEPRYVDVATVTLTEVQLRAVMEAAVDRYAAVGKETS